MISYLSKDVEIWHEDGNPSADLKVMKVVYNSKYRSFHNMFFDSSIKLSFIRNFPCTANLMANLMRQMPGKSSGRTAVPARVDGSPAVHYRCTQLRNTV